MNSFHYHNAVDGYIHYYQTLEEIAYAVASVASVDRNLNVNYRRIDGDYNAAMFQIHLSYSDDDSAGAVDLLASSSKSRLASVVILVPR